MDILGDIPVTGNPIPKASGPMVHLATFKENVFRSNQNAIRHIKNSNKGEKATRTCRITQQEVENGRLKPLGPADIGTLNEYPGTHRFFISEPHGNQEVAFMVIADLERSGVNATVGRHDAYLPDDISEFFATVGAMRRTPGRYNTQCGYRIAAPP